MIISSPSILSQLILGEFWFVYIYLRSLHFSTLTFFNPTFLPINELELDANWDDVFIWSDRPWEAKRLLMLLANLCYYIYFHSISLVVYLNFDLSLLVLSLEVVNSLDMLLKLPNKPQLLELLTDWFISSKLNLYMFLVILRFLLCAIFGLLN